MQVGPVVSLPEAFSSSGSDALPDRWWTAFGDGQLNALVERALEENFSLRTARDRLDQAWAVAERAGAEAKPGLDATGGLSREARKVAGLDRAYATDFSLGIEAGYEVDLWGRVGASRDASLLDALATEEDLHAAAVGVSAEVGRTWHRLIEQRLQLGLLDEQIATNEKHLDVITLKFRRGQVSATDVLQQRQLVESTRGERVLVESSLSVLEHQLAVLLGQPPGALDLAPDGDLPGVPPEPQTGLPLELIRRRPDVRAAELRIRAADRRVAVAIADRFPALRLSARGDTSAEELSGLFEGWLTNLAASVAAPLLDAGLRRAEVERTRAVLSERLNSYGDVVLAALQEVEDALSQEASQSEYVASLARQLELSGQSAAQTLENYTKGTADFTRYLTTLLSHQRLQRTFLQARLELVLSRIALYRALAGSWPSQAGEPENTRN